jgi:hypothetical protein
VKERRVERRTVRVAVGICILVIPGGVEKFLMMKIGGWGE